MKEIRQRRMLGEITGWKNARCLIDRGGNKGRWGPNELVIKMEIKRDWDKMRWKQRWEQKEMETKGKRDKRRWETKKEESSVAHLLSSNKNLFGIYISSTQVKYL